MKPHNNHFGEEVSPHLLSRWWYCSACMQERNEKQRQEEASRERALAREKHLSDVEFVNQNGRGK